RGRWLGPCRAKRFSRLANTARYWRRREKRVARQCPSPSSRNSMRNAGWRSAHWRPSRGSPFWHSRARLPRSVGVTDLHLCARGAAWEGDDRQANGPAGGGPVRMSAMGGFRLVGFWGTDPKIGHSSGGLVWPKPDWQLSSVEHRTLDVRRDRPDQFRGSIDIRNGLPNWMTWCIEFART